MLDDILNNDFPKVFNKPEPRELVSLEAIARELVICNLRTTQAILKKQEQNAIKGEFAEVKNRHDELDRLYDEVLDLVEFMNGQRHSWVIRKLELIRDDIEKGFLEFSDLRDWGYDG